MKKSEKKTQKIKHTTDKFPLHKKCNTWFTSGMKFFAYLDVGLKLLLKVGHTTGKFDFQKKI